MENQKKKKNKFFISIIFLLIFLNSCVQPNTNETQKTNEIIKTISCYNVKKISVPMNTKIDLEKFNTIYYERHLKNDEKESFQRKKLFVYKNYDKKLKRWNFTSTDSLFIDSDYAFLFINKIDTIRILLTDIEIGKKPIYADGSQTFICSLVQYKINSKVIISNNISF